MFPYYKNSSDAPKYKDRISFFFFFLILDFNWCEKSKAETSHIVAAFMYF